METKRVILARFIDFDNTPTNVLLRQPDVRFSQQFSCLFKIYQKINFGNYLPQFYILYHCGKNERRCAPGRALPLFVSNTKEHQL